MAITSSIVVNPVSVVCTIPVSLLIPWYAADYLKTAREVKRLESIALSPIFDHFATAVTGLTYHSGFWTHGKVSRHCLPPHRSVLSSRRCRTAP
ncbi:P-loop containing nucleoside triphosphate hydrolase protein [Penicillium freii]|nr:P-loop containing nucleoside triphosphate hydrolase protein [Penicillium freii]